MLARDPGDTVPSSAAEVNIFPVCGAACGPQLPPQSVSNVNSRKRVGGDRYQRPFSVGRGHWSGVLNWSIRLQHPVNLL
jgi:hypothetical protein